MCTCRSLHEPAARVRVSHLPSPESHTRAQPVQRVPPPRSGGNLEAEIARERHLELLRARVCVKPTVVLEFCTTGCEVVQQAAQVLREGNSGPNKSKWQVQVRVVRIIKSICRIGFLSPLTGNWTRQQQDLLLSLCVFVFFILLCHCRCTSPRLTPHPVWACPQTPSTVTAWDTLRECWAATPQRRSPLAACPGAQAPSLSL